jgi:hypothetical protein
LLRAARWSLQDPDEVENARLIETLERMVRERRESERKP